MAPWLLRPYLHSRSNSLWNLPCFWLFLEISAVYIASPMGVPQRNLAPKFSSASFQHFCATGSREFRSVSKRSLQKNPSVVIQSRFQIQIWARASLLIDNHFQNVAQELSFNKSTSPSTTTTTPTLRPSLNHYFSIFSKIFLGKDQWLIFTGV